MSPNEWKVLAVLGEGVEYDFGFWGFAGIMKQTGLDRKTVRRCCRSLRRKGLALFESGLWTDEGEPAGSGYCSTAKGRDLLKRESQEAA